MHDFSTDEHALSANPHRRFAVCWNVKFFVGISLAAKRASEGRLDRPGIPNASEPRGFYGARVTDMSPFVRGATSLWASSRVFWQNVQRLPSGGSIFALPRVILTLALGLIPAKLLVSRVTGH